MKKVYLLGALSGLLLASCANDDLVVKPAPTTGEGDAPISFTMKVGNQSRATEALENVMDNFGVWAFKGDDAADDLKALSSVTDFKNSALTVMPNYRVNYLNTLSYGSNWNYVTAEWPDPASLTQYLKYWDGSVAKTYFFAYGPHTSVLGDDVTLTFDAEDVKATMEFPKFVTSSDPNANFIYADVRIEDNATHVTYNATPPSNTGDPAINTTLQPLTVPLTFHRIPSQVKIAIWEEIPGYDVQMQPLIFAGETAVNGVVAIPANYTAPKTWARGSYLSEGVPSVVYTTSTNPYDQATLSFTEGKTANTNLNFALPTTNIDANGNIGTTYGNRSFSETVYNVMPNGKPAAMPAITMASGSLTANSGLQFVMNYQLKSVDTKEVINVKNARCYVDPVYTAWEPNTIYTYVFKITKRSSGNTSGDVPQNDPEHPEDALYPIIFEGVMIESALTNETEWLVNGVEFEFSAATMTVAPGSTNNTFGFTYDGTALTWTVSPDGAATVTPTLTPYTFTDADDNDITYPGTATVAAGTNPGRVTITATNVNGASATIDVVITNGVDILNYPAGYDEDTAPMAMTEGETYQLDYVSDGTVTWTSSADAVATVDAYGKISAVAAGEATITGTKGSVTSTIKVKVTAAP